MKKIKNKAPKTSDKDVLFDLLAGEVVPLPPTLVAAIGDGNPAMIFRQAIFMQFGCKYPELYEDENGKEWIFCPAEKLQEKTGLKPYQQASARKILVSAGFWSEKTAKAPEYYEGKVGTYFSINKDAFVDFYRTYLNGEGSARKQRLQKNNASKEIVISRIMKSQNGDSNFTNHEITKGGNFTNHEITKGGNFTNHEITHLYNSNRDINLEILGIETLPETFVSEGVCTPIFQIEIEEQKPSTSTQKKEEQNTRGAGGGEPGAAKANKAAKKPEYAIEWPDWTKEVFAMFDEVGREKDPEGYEDFNWKHKPEMHASYFRKSRLLIEDDIKRAKVEITVDLLRAQFRQFLGFGYDYCIDLKNDSGKKVHYYRAKSLYDFYPEIKQLSKAKSAVSIPASSEGPEIIKQRCVYFASQQKDMFQQWAKEAGVAGKIKSISSEIEKFCEYYSFIASPKIKEQFYRDPENFLRIKFPEWLSRAGQPVGGGTNSSANSYPMDENRCRQEYAKRHTQTFKHLTPEQVTSLCTAQSEHQFQVFSENINRKIIASLSAKSDA